MPWQSVLFSALLWLTDSRPLAAHSLVPRLHLNATERPYRWARGRILWFSVACQNQALVQLRDAVLHCAEFVDKAVFERVETFASIL